MKKVIAIVLALVMAMSCTAIAFAADTVYTCPFCNKSFTSYGDAVKDIMDCYTKAVEALDPDAKVFLCPLCGSQFETYEKLLANFKSCYTKALNNLSTTTTEPKQEWSNTCPYCGNIFTSESIYDEHIDICYSQNAGVVNGHGNFFNLTANQILDMLHDFFSRDTDLWSTVSGIIIRIIDLFENLGTVAATEADVAGAVDELEAKVASLPLVGDALEYVHNLINTLKQKIKDIYAHDVETVAEEPVSTGSTSVGIAAFAAVSIAAASAYVCTKKKED